MFPMAMFSMVLLAIVVKHADGMRGPSQAASMIEREVALWGKKCAQFGAKKKSWWSNTCQCPQRLPVPRKCEGTSGRTFNLKKTIKAGSSDCRCASKCAQFGAKRHLRDDDWCICPKHRPEKTKECEKHRNGAVAKRLYFDPSGVMLFAFARSDAAPGCRCATFAELTEHLQLPVSASALRFCEALARQSFYQANHSVRAMTGGKNPMEVIIKDNLQKTSRDICQHALIGTINKAEARRAPWAEEASELSQRGSDEDGDEDRGYGRMQPVKEDATTPAEKVLWEDALARVCKDECENLLDLMKWEAHNLALDVLGRHVPFAQTCAERVVQQVEAEVLGCCARSCAFDGHRCLLWPFFSAEEKVNWNVECCGEMSTLKNSSRERMCNSVLSGRLAKEASQYDLEEEDGTDVGKVLIGQNNSLFWTTKGAQKFGTRAGAKVSIDFLLEHKNLGEEYLLHGYFREEPFSKVFDGGASSVLQVDLQDDTMCDFGKVQQQCPKEFHKTYVKTCKKSWSVTQVSHDSEETFHDLVTHPGGGNCIESDPQLFATPEDCEKLAKNSGEIFLHYFTYDEENKEKPIKCFSLSKQQCEGKDQWWTTIPLVSVQELVKTADVNIFAELTYVRVKEH